MIPIVNENDTVATARDPLRRQRPAGRAGRPPGPRRRAGAALRRRRPLHRRPAPARARSSSTEVASTADLAGVRRRPARAAGVGTGGMATKSTPRAIATQRGHPGRCSRSAAAGRRRAGRARVGTLLPPGRRPHRVAAVLAAARHHAARPAACSTPAPSPRSSSGARRCCRPASPRWPATSTPATRSSSSARTASPSPAAWSATTRADLPAAARPQDRRPAAEFRREVVHRDDLVLLPAAMRRQSSQADAGVRAADRVQAPRQHLAGKCGPCPGVVATTARPRVAPRVGDGRANADVRSGGRSCARARGAVAA